MTQYLLTSTIAATILLVVYQLFLEKEKMHRFNRFYLLISLLFSLLIPFISIEIIKEITTPATVPIPMNFSGGTMVIAEETNYFEQTLWGIYVLVTAILVFRFIRNIVAFYQLKKNNATLSFQNATLVLLQEPVLPHTFMNSIFINEAEYQERKIEKELFAHEMTHVNQKHTLDVLFVELIKTIFWFNPLFVLYKKAIQLNHEFLADEKVVQSYKNIPFYQSLLLSKASCNPPLYLASNLNFQVTKKRFLMMSRNSSKKIILGKQLALLPIFTALFCYFCLDLVAQTQPQKPINTQQQAQQTTQENKDMDTYYAGVLVNVTDKRRNITSSKKYEALTLEEKNIYLSLTPKTFGKTTLTKAQWEDFKNSSKYTIYINNIPVTKGKLPQEPLANIVRFGGGPVPKSERSKKYPQPYKYYIYTEDYFKYKNINESKKFAGKSINIEVAPTEKSLEKKLRAVAKKGITYTAPTKVPIPVPTESTPPLSNDVVFNVAGITEKPEFPGGMEKFYKFVGNNFQAPTEPNLKGKVYVNLLN